MQHPREHAIEILWRIDAKLLVQWYYDFAVRMRLKGVRLRKLFSEHLVVVDLPVDRQRNVLIFADDRLRARVNADDAQALVYQDCAVRGVVAAPIWTSMPHAASLSVS